MIYYYRGLFNRIQEVKLIGTHKYRTSDGYDSYIAVDYLIEFKNGKRKLVKSYQLLEIETNETT